MENTGISDDDKLVPLTSCTNSQNDNHNVVVEIDAVVDIGETYGIPIDNPSESLGVMLTESLSSDENQIQNNPQDEYTEEAVDVPEALQRQGDLQHNDDISALVSSSTIGAQQNHHVVVYEVDLSVREHESCLVQGVGKSIVVLPSTMDSVIPDTIAAETEVTTSDQTSNMTSSLQVGDDTVPLWVTEKIQMPDSSQGSDLDQIAICSVGLNQDQEGTSSMSKDEEIVQQNHEMSVKEATKKERDRLYRKKLRQDPDFRAREKEKTKIRMQKLRSNDKYRERERALDRVRRYNSRRLNTELRLKERERDKTYRKMQRNLSNSNGIETYPLEPVITFNTAYSQSSNSTSVKVEQSNTRILTNNLGYS